MIINELEKVLSNVFDELDYHIDNVKVIKSNRLDLCDYQCDDIFKLAKTYHDNPINIGEKIINKIKTIENSDYYFKEITFVKPGFINIKVGNQLLNDVLRKMHDLDKFGIGNPDKVNTFILDYGGPNIAKPLHVGHLRPAIIGEAMKRIISYLGHKTIADVHLGDYGLQIGQVIYGIMADKKDIDLITLDYLKETYPKISKLCKEDSDILNSCAEITKKLQDGDEYYHKLWKKICEISISDTKRLYDYLDVHFDLWKGESDSYPYIDELLDFLKPYTTVSDGAKVIDIKKDDDNKNMPPLILQKSNGAYLYATTDLATILERKKDFNPDYIIYFTDLRQSLHFEQVFRVCEKCHLIDAKLEHVGFGTINGPDGKPFKTRNGDMLSLDELIQDVTNSFKELKDSNKDMDLKDINIIVNAIIKYADLQNNRSRDYIFDINKFSSVVGKTGPYILYTYLRINKILNEEKESNYLSNNIYNQDDLNLRIKLTDLKEALVESFNTRQPNYLADYIYDVCVCLNTFYQSNHIHNLEDEVKKSDYLYVLNLANKVIKEMLHLLIIDIPSEM